MGGAAVQAGAVGEFAQSRAFGVCRDAFQQVQGPLHGREVGAAPDQGGTIANLRRKGGLGKNPERAPERA